jgi:hypothetical protein
VFDRALSTLQSRPWRRRPATEAVATIGVQLGVAPNAQHHGIEGRAILPVADVVKLELFTRFALLATIAGASKRSTSHSQSKLIPHWPIYGCNL